MSVDDARDVTRRNDVTPADVRNFIINNINRDNIRRSLRHLTLEPHLGGTEGELGVARWVAQTWQRQGLDQVHLVPYQTLLSYPDPLTPNLVRIVDGEGNTAWVSAAKQKSLYAPEEASPELPFTFLGYAPRGNVTGDVVYAYYGREEDFHFLAEEGIDVSGRIVIARYGQIFRANIVSYIFLVKYNMEMARSSLIVRSRTEGSNLMQVVIVCNGRFLIFYNLYIQIPKRPLRLL
nr:glutamate carboxypeptidase 2-like [Procambarus clarkii]